MKLSDKQIVDDIIHSLSRHGYNTDRSMVSTMMTVVMEDLKDAKERLVSIHNNSDMTIDFQMRSVVDQIKEDS